MKFNPRLLTACFLLASAIQANAQAAPITGVCKGLALSPHDSVASGSIDEEDPKFRENARVEVSIDPDTLKMQVRSWDARETGAAEGRMVISGQATRSEYSPKVPTPDHNKDQRYSMEDRRGAMDQSDDYWADRYPVSVDTYVATVLEGKLVRFYWASVDGPQGEYSPNAPEFFYLKFICSEK